MWGGCEEEPQIGVGKKAEERAQEVKPLKAHDLGEMGKNGQRHKLPVIT